MSSFTLPFLPSPGNAITADWGRRVVECLRRLTPIAGKDTKLDFTPNGVVYSSTAKADAVAAETSSLKPFTVRWFPKGDNKGEWQIYIPFGTVSMRMRGVNYFLPCVCVNAAATDGDGNDIYRWYAFDPPDEGEGEIRNIGGIGYQSVPVHLVLKPYARFKISTKREDYGPVCESHVVGAANVAKYTKDGESVTSRVGTNLGLDSLRVDDGAEEKRFAILYEFSENDLYDPSATPAVKVANMRFMAGRSLIADEDNVDVSGWSEVWMRVKHNVSHSSEIKMDIVGSEEASDDTQTCVLLYRLEDGVVTVDNRASALNGLSYYNY